MTKDVIVIGGGAAGMLAARRAAECGAQSHAAGEERPAGDEDTHLRRRQVQPDPRRADGGRAGEVPAQ